MNEKSVGEKSPNNKPPKNVVKAIIRAKGAEKCSYSAGCVIQQIALLEGKDFSQFDNSERATEPYDVLIALDDSLELPYPKSSLVALQEWWDDTPEKGPHKKNFYDFACTLDWEKE
jgi:hypothetical protein